ncbi:sialate O-acetylesterase [Shigella flexneri]
MQNGTEPAMMLVVGELLYSAVRDSQLSRTRAALAKNPQNKFLGVCWMQGEFDLMTSDDASHPQHFNHMVEAFRRDLNNTILSLISAT